MSLLASSTSRALPGSPLGLALAFLLAYTERVTRAIGRSRAPSSSSSTSGEQAAFAGTVANYRAAAETARAADQANVTRVAAEQRAINERTADDFEARLAAARAAADRLRRETAVRRSRSRPWRKQRQCPA